MYDFYRNEYRGTAVEQEEFPQLLARAEDQLSMYQHSYRVRGDETAKKMALCAMAEVIAYFEAARNGQGGLRFVSVGTVSISGKGIYSQVDISQKAQEKALYRTARRYLQISRGIG